MSQNEATNQRRGNRLTRVLVAIVVINSLVLAFAIGTKWTPLTRPAPKSLHSGIGFEGSAKVAPEEVEADFKQATEAKDYANRSGNVWNAVANVLDWIAFGLSTVITVVAAFYGEPTAGVGGPGIEAQLAQVRARARRNAWIVGIVAGGIAFSTAISTRAHSEAKARYKRADDLVAAMDQSRMALDNSGISQAEQRRTLQRMVDLASRTGE
jgi:hypothetical protein